MTRREVRLNPEGLENLAAGLKLPIEIDGDTAWLYTNTADYYATLPPVKVPTQREATP